MNTTPYQEALGLALNDAAAANKLIDLDVGDFEAEQDKEIFAAIKTLKAERKPATIVTVDTELGGRHTAYMIDITSSAYLPSLIGTYGCTSLWGDFYRLFLSNGAPLTVTP